MIPFGSCSRRLTDFTVISTKNVPIGDGVHTEFKKGDRRVKGKDVTHEILAIPLGYPNMKEAIDRAIEQIPGAVGLVDGVVKEKSWSFILYGQNAYIVEGTPIFPVSEYSSNTSNNFSSKQIEQRVEQYVPVEAPQNTDGTITISHTVNNGETLSAIAQMYGVTIRDIIKWNNLKESSISKGQRLIIILKDE